MLPCGSHARLTRTASAASRFIETSEELERRADGFVKEVGAFRLPAST